MSGKEFRACVCGSRHPFLAASSEWREASGEWRVASNELRATSMVRRGLAQAAAVVEHSLASQADQRVVAVGFDVKDLRWIDRDPPAVAVVDQEAVERH